MSSLAVLQPALTDTFSFYYQSGGTNQFTFTIAEILSKVKDIDSSYDSFILVSSTGGTSPNKWSGLYYVHPFTVGTKENYYIADGEYLEISGTNQYNNVLVESTDITFQRRRYYFNSQGNLTAGGNSPGASADKDGIYYTYDSLISSSLDHPETAFNVLYISANITNLYINGALPILYQWSSVPAISGKNGILSLSTIKSAYINDGEPVTGATASNFDALTEETNVGTLVNDTSVDESKVVVRYNIPDGTYQYIKLVYKPNSEPETVSDGVVINIPQVDSQVVIDDIITTGTYYFKIFTNAGNSNTVVLNYVGILPIIINIERVW